MNLKKFFFPTLIIFLLLIADGFLLNDLQIESEKSFPPFETLSLDEKIFTEKIFDEKITVIFFWTTNQEICFKTLSELAEIQKIFSDKIQIVGLVGDVRTNEIEKFPAAKKISKKFAPNILQLTVNDNFFPVLEKIHTVPMTIFVDKNKNIIGQAVGSTDSDFIRQEIKYILEKDSPKNIAQKKIHEIILYR